MATRSTYNNLDNNRGPTKGILAELRQDFAGVGGDVRFVRTAADVYGYHEIVGDLIGTLHLQGGHITGWGCKNNSQIVAGFTSECLRMLDHFQMGRISSADLPLPASGRATCRALASPARETHWAERCIGAPASKCRRPSISFPRTPASKSAAYADAGSLWNYVGPTSWAATGETLSGSICPVTPCPLDNSMHIRSSVGVGLIWDSPFGPLRFDYAVPLTSEPYDRTQRFRFGGGTKF